MNEGPLNVEIRMTAARRRFAQEFKSELCREVIGTSKPIKDGAIAHGVGSKAVRSWMGEYRKAHGDRNITPLQRP